MKQFLLFFLIVMMVSCTAPRTQTEAVPLTTDSSQANLPNPASAHCEEQGYTLEIRTAEDGSQAGYCLFPDGSECDEWAFFRGECGPSPSSEEAAIETQEVTSEPTAIPTAVPIDPAGYQGWWTYAHPDYGFSIMLPEDWVVEEVTTGDPLMSGHTLTLRPEYVEGKESIRLAFRRTGEDARLWPTGVGQGEFISQGDLDVAGEPAQRVLLVCPSGEVTAIWYHQAEGQPNIARGDLEFGFIFSAGSHCEEGQSLTGKIQLLGEMIIASLQVP